jgi:hypothetical protein
MFFKKKKDIFTIDYYPISKLYYPRYNGKYIHKCLHMEFKISNSRKVFLGLILK